MSEEQKLPPADSESEDDEDYVPPEANDDDDDDDPSSSTINDPTLPIPTLSTTKQLAVDDAFADLFGKPHVAPKPKEKKKKPKSKKALKKNKILSEIFGGDTIASKLIASSRDIAKKNDAESRSKRNGSALKKLEKVEIKEQIKFAGQMIEISRTVVSGEANKPAGIDAVLSQINGPQKFTTIDKTNVDWDNFKDKTGMEEELKKKAEGKDAYLVKKDFLNRVDARRFEQEKDDRSRKRAAGPSSSK